MGRITLLFDLDGTLTDPKEGIVRCIRYALEELRIPCDIGASLDWCIGPPLRQSFEQLLGPEREELAPQALALYRRRFGDVGLFENRLYEGIVPCLERLAVRYDLFVATAKPTVYAERIVRHFGLTGYFRAVCGSELDGKNSEKGDLIRSILESERLSAATAIMIGDREHDMRGAGKNGVRAIGAAWGYGSEQELRDSGAVAIVREPGELPPTIDKWAGISNPKDR